jgi:hypothetical protein
MDATIFGYLLVGSHVLAAWVGTFVALCARTEDAQYNALKLADLKSDFERCFCRCSEIYF